VRLIRVFSIGLLLFCSSTAWALGGDTNGVFGLDGNVRTLLLGAETDDVHQGLGQGSLRFVAGGKPASWLSYEVHGVADLTVTTAAFSRFYRGEAGRGGHPKPPTP
jgi:hypothetical protein